MASFGGALLASGLGVVVGSRWRKLDAAERRAEDAEAARDRALAEERAREMRAAAQDTAIALLQEQVRVLKGGRP